MRRADGTIVGPDGKFVTDSRGRPIQLGDHERFVVGKDGRGYIIREDGSVIGPDGRLLLDQYGRPVILKPGERLVLGVDGSVRDQSGQQVLGAGGRKLLPGERLTVGPDGQMFVQKTDKTIVRPDGGIMAYPDGRPMHIPPGAKLVV